MLTSAGPAAVRSGEYHQIFLPRAGNPPPVVRFAVVGDYGVESAAAADVAALVKGWKPDFVITTGDNNYPSGDYTTIDRHIGAYYHDFIAPYKGAYGAGSPTNRFFPALGNHDWATGALPYLDYFNLPGNERYYEFKWEHLRLFALDSDPQEPDGVSSDSIQAEWLKNRLAASDACWNLVYMHHPPLSSGPHGPTPWMQWPFEPWGADAVIAGHDHLYERIVRGGRPYFVNGLGGNVPYPFGPPVEGSVLRFNADYGAMLVTAWPDELVFLFITRSGAVVDDYRLQRPCSQAPQPQAASEAPN